MAAPSAKHDDEQSLVTIREILNDIPGQVALHEQIAHVPPAHGSRLHQDDELTHPFQNSHLVSLCLGMSIDALRTLRAVVTAEEGHLTLPQYGHYPLIRQSLEASSQAIWLMAPEDRRERVLRNLTARASELLHDKALIETYTDISRARNKAERSRMASGQRAFSKQRRIKDKYTRAIAGPLGIDRDEYTKRLHYGDIVEEAGTHIGLQGHLSRGLWQLVSGLTHPSASRALATGSIEEVLPPTGDIRHVRISTDRGHVAVAMLWTFRHYVAADVMYREQMGIIPTVATPGATP
ncbi:hypothetical protein [Naasia sp. SYSU D00948]|uniref:hypothetical protein n=1 Tax=Naasia sp. SYSU D00948 TaxID=2817379 RepID=UPI001B307048|nr:hypothetical protein [Naasia sp. SYSU D00948]